MPSTTKSWLATTTQQASLPEPERAERNLQQHDNRDDEKRVRGGHENALPDLARIKPHSRQPPTKRTGLSVLALDLTPREDPPARGAVPYNDLTQPPPDCARRHLR